MIIQRDEAIVDVGPESVNPETTCVSSWLINMSPQTVHVNVVLHLIYTLTSAKKNCLLSLLNGAYYTTILRGIFWYRTVKRFCHCATPFAMCQVRKSAHRSNVIFGIKFSVQMCDWWQHWAVMPERMSLQLHLLLTLDGLFFQSS